MELLSINCCYYEARTFEHMFSLERDETTTNITVLAPFEKLEDRVGVIP